MITRLFVTLWTFTQCFVWIHTTSVASTHQNSKNWSLILKILGFWMCIVCLNSSRIWRYKQFPFNYFLDEEIKFGQIYFITPLFYSNSVGCLFKNYEFLTLLIFKFTKALRCMHPPKQCVGILKLGISEEGCGCKTEVCSQFSWFHMFFYVKTNIFGKILQFVKFDVGTT